ncbi:MAG: ABC transporter substrate-binding protein [Proteobacteria bacterium]|nr:ABC transporter substrate-binding protein [Pseudomonadota bacterium]
MKHMRFSTGRVMRATGLMAAAIFLLNAAPSSVLAQSLAGCPDRIPKLRIAVVTGSESYSPHPAETRFSATHYARLHQMPLFGADPLEKGVDAAYGIAESWKYLPGAAGMIVTIRKGLTFNNGTPITAEDVVFSLKLSASKFADSQINGTLKGIGVKAKALDTHTVQIDFKKGAPTFHLELSPLVFPIYVTSKAYHSNGEISQKSFDKFRAKPLAAGPYRVIARQAEQFITLVAARKDPLLGCPVYDRIEIRSVLETGTRMNQFRTGQQDIISGSRDLLRQAKKIGATVVSKPDANTIGLYIFQADHKDNVFNNIDVRKAAAYAIDHKLIADTIWSGVGVTPWGCTWPPATEISMSNPRFVKACATPYPYDPAKAKAHLAAAGYKPGKGPTIRIEYSVSYPEEAAFAEAMQPMFKAVGFNALIARVDRAERDRRRWNDGHLNTVLFFGPGGRVTSLSGAYSVWGPKRGWGPKHDKDIVAALKRASQASSVEAYTEGIADLAEVIKNKAYGPGYFSAGSVYFVRKGIGDWGLGKSKGRGPLNLSALVTRR